MIGGVYNKCSLSSKSNAPSTGDTVKTTETFPDYCIGFCNLNLSCIGFEMKEWGSEFRCEAMSSTDMTECINAGLEIDNDSYYSVWYMDYTYYQPPSTVTGRCTHILA